MQPRRGTEIDGDAEWDVVKIADHAHGMRISMGQRIGYAPMRKVIVTEQLHPGTIIAQTTNQNNKKRTQLHHKLLIISFDKG